MRFRAGGGPKVLTRNRAAASALPGRLQLDVAVQEVVHRDSDIGANTELGRVGLRPRDRVERQRGSHAFEKVDDWPLQLILRLRRHCSGCGEVLRQALTEVVEERSERRRHPGILAAEADGEPRRVLSP